MVSLEKVRDTARGEAGQALRTGSAILARRAWGLIAPDAPVWQRLGYTAAGGYITVAVAQSQPAVIPWAVPGAVIGWCVAAWTIAPGSDPQPEPEGEPHETPRTAFVLWLLATIGDRPGIHLQELYPAMRQLPGHGELDDGQLREALRTLGIPVRRSLRIGAVAGRSGVHRDDLSPLPQESGEKHVETGGDAGQSADSPPLSTHGEDPEST